MTKRTVIIGYNPSFAKIFSDDNDACQIASDTLSFIVENYEKTDAYQKGGWDGRSTMFDWAKKIFPSGLVFKVEQALRGAGYKVLTKHRPLPTPQGVPQSNHSQTVDDFPYCEDYEYQFDTLKELLKRGRMIARVATGGGKSRIAKICTAHLGLNTMFLTTRKALMYQMKQHFEDAGFKVGVVGDGEWTPELGEHAVNVGMVQTLSQRLAGPDYNESQSEILRKKRLRDNTKEFLEQVRFLIGEEAHESGGNGFFDVSQACRNADYGLALTATPFMKGSSEANMRLQAVFGDIGIHISEKFLIGKGILATPYFCFMPTTKPKGLRKTMGYSAARTLGIVENEYRNSKILEVVKSGYNYNRTTLVLVQLKKHGQILQNLLAENGLKVEFIFGESSETRRRQVLTRLGAKEIDCVIGSSILDVGVDVPELGQIVLAGGGKDEIQLRQRIGRGLRKKKTGPNKVPVYDFQDEHNTHLFSHYMQRRRVIESTPGFAENILKPGQSFDYEGHGFIRR